MQLAWPVAVTFLLFCNGACQCLIVVVFATGGPLRDRFLSHCERIIAVALATCRGRPIAIAQIAGSWWFHSQAGGLSYSLFASFIALALATLQNASHLLLSKFATCGGDSL
jgi:hypothetical protein